MYLIVFIVLFAVLALTMIKASREGLAGRLAFLALFIAAFELFYFAQSSFTDHPSANRNYGVGALALIGSIVCIAAWIILLNRSLEQASEA